jgi:hypothetical protein
LLLAVAVEEPETVVVEVEVVLVDIAHLLRHRSLLELLILLR